jgi:hypothetical protein
MLVRASRNSRSNVGKGRGKRGEASVFRELSDWLLSFDAAHWDMTTLLVLYV